MGSSTCHIHRQPPFPCPTAGLAAGDKFLGPLTPPPPSVPLPAWLVLAQASVQHRAGLGSLPNDRNAYGRRGVARRAGLGPAGVGWWSQVTNA